MNRKVIISLFLFYCVISFRGYAFTILNDDETHSNDLKIELSCDQTEFLRGESIDILVKLTNNTGRTIRTGSPKHFLYHLGKDSNLTNHYGHAVMDIPPYGTKYYFINPIGYISYSETAFLRAPWYEGSYEYYISLFEGKKRFSSNKIEIRINPVPDSLLMPFNELTSSLPGKFHTTEEWESLFEKYKGTYYEQEFFYKLLHHHKGSKKEFVLKYPDTEFSFLIIRSLNLNYEENKTILEDILSSLSTVKPDCKLLEALRNQPEYLHYQKINQFLDKIGVKK